MVGLIAGLLGVFTAVMLVSQKGVIEDELDARIVLMKNNLVDRGKSFSDNMVRQIEEAIASFNLMSVVSQMGRAVDEHDELDYIVLVDADGVVRIHTKKPHLQGEPLVADVDGGGPVQGGAFINEYEEYGLFYMEFVVPVELSGALWGSLRIGYSMEVVNRAIYAANRRRDEVITGVFVKTAVITVLFVVVGVIAVVVMANRLTRPVMNLATLSSEVAKGNFRAVDAIVVRSDDEIGVLSSAFTSMADNLAASQAGLENVNRYLADKVQLRTAELASARDEAVAANVSKTRFLANMSHEIRTPLNAIVGFSRLLMKDDGEDAGSIRGEKKQFLKNIKTSGENLAELVNNILDLSKIESGKTTVDMEGVNLRLLVQGIFHINKAAAIRKKLLYTYDCDMHLPEVVYTDRSKLNQILMNLVSNAVKFTPAGKAVSINADCDNGKSALRFTVRDEGIGIAPESMEAIFEPFVQAETSTNRLFGGTGLGLNVARGMAELLGGAIQVESEVDRGSEFTCEIPWIVPPEMAVDGIGFRDVKFCDGNTVLVVEDNQMNQQMMVATFKEIGVRCYIAGSGAAAVLMAPGLRLDLILMDVHMPGMDGIETSRHLRCLDGCRDVPIVILSADVFDDWRERAKDVGIVDGLTKPLDRDRLMDVLSKYLRLEDDDKPPGGVVVDARPLMPDDIRRRLVDEFGVLSEIPYYLTGNVSSKALEMAELCKPYDSPFGDILTQIDEAAFAGDAARIKALIKKAIG